MMINFINYQQEHGFLLISLLQFSLKEMNCPDIECYELAMKLHNKLRYLSGGNEDDQDLVSLLDCLIQEERMRLHNQRPYLYLVK
jgi:hypothetical protein